MDPSFFQGIGYNVSDASSDTISAFDAPSLFASSILAAALGYMSIENITK